jgi:hypothetical protein
MQEQINPNPQKEQQEQAQQQERKTEKQPKKMHFSGQSHRQSYTHLGDGSEDLSTNTIRAKHRPIRAKHTPIKRSYQPIRAKQRPVQRSQHKGDLPQKLAHNLEQMTGVSMQGVKVVKNSPVPAQYQAEALAMYGEVIHLARGKEQHLPEEAAHIARQRQGGLIATMFGSINADKNIEQQDRKIGAQANQSDWLPLREVGETNLSRSSSPVVQRHEGEFDILDILSSKSTKVKDLGVQALLHLIKQYSTTKGAALVEEELLGVCQQADYLISTVAQKVVEMVPYVGKVVSWGVAIRKYLKAYQHFKEEHPFLTTVIKYLIGRVSFFVLQKLLGESTAHHWVTKALTFDDTLLDIIDRFDYMAQGIDALVKLMPSFDQGFAGNQAKANKFIPLVRDYIQSNPQREYAAHHIEQFLADDINASEENKAFIDRYILAIYRKRHAGDKQFASSEEALTTLQVIEDIFQVPAIDSVHAALQYAWKTWLSHQFKAEGKTIGEWLVDTSFNATIIATGVGLGITAAGAWVATSNPLLGTGIAVAGLLTVASSKLYDYYANKNKSTPDTESRAEASPSVDSENRKEEAETTKKNAAPKSDIAEDTEKKASSKFFWLKLHEADIKEWEKEDDNKTKTGGANVRFGMGFNLFGKELMASNDHNLHLDWAGSFDYTNQEIKLVDGTIGFENAFTIQNILLKNIHINNQGLESLRVEFNQVKIAGDTVVVHQISGDWSKDKGFTFTASATANIVGNHVTGMVNFGLTKEGKFRKGGFSISNDDKKSLDIIPGTLSILPEKFELGILEDKSLVGSLLVGANLSTEHVQFDTGQVLIEYDKGWTLKAEDMRGKIFLPGKKELALQAGFRLEKGKIAAYFNSTTNALENIVPDVLSISPISVSGEIDQANHSWSVMIKGRANLTTDQVHFNTGEVTFTYQKINDQSQWSLSTSGLSGKVFLPGDKEITIDANLGIENNLITGDFVSTTNALQNIIPNVLSVDSVKVSGQINQAEKHWSLLVEGQATLTTDYVNFETGKVTFTYDNKAGWSLVADDIQGHIPLPGEKGIDLKAQLRIEKNKLAGSFVAVTNALKNIVPGVFSIEQLSLSGSLNQADATWRVDVNATAFLMLAGKRLDGALALNLSNEGFVGKLNIALTDDIEIIPDALALTAASFEGGISWTGKKPVLNAKLSGSIKTLSDKYFSVKAGNAFIEYDQSKGTSTADHWTVGVEQFRAGIWGDRVSLTFDDVQYSFGQKELTLSKVTLAYNHSPDKDKGELEKDEKFDSLKNILNIIKQFHVAASLQNITLNEEGFGIKGKPDWSLREFEMEYKGFMLKVVIEGDDKITGIMGRLQGGYTGDFNLLKAEFDIPVGYGFNVVGGANIVAKVKATAGIDLRYDRARSQEEGKPYFDIGGDIGIDGRLALELVLGASVGAVNLVSIGGQLYGQFGVDINTKARAQSTLFYDKNDKKVHQGDKLEDKFNIHVHAGFSPVIAIGGRLVFKLLGQKFNLLDYQFGKWNFGQGALVFDIKPDEKERYGVVLDREQTQFNGKNLAGGNLQSIAGKFPEAEDSLKQYKELRDTLDKAELNDLPEDRQRYIEKLENEAPVTKESLFDLMKGMVVRKEEALDEKEALKDDDSHLSWFAELKEKYREFKENHRLDKEIEDIEESLHDIKHELKKVILLSRNPEEAVKALEKRRDSFLGRISTKEFGIWQTLRYHFAEEEIQHEHPDMKPSSREFKKLAKERSQQLKANIKAQIEQRFREIESEVKSERARNRQSPDDGTDRLPR